jgi:hypothetical protein
VELFLHPEQTNTIASAKTTDLMCFIGILRLQFMQNLVLTPRAHSFRRKAAS